MSAEPVTVLLDVDGTLVDTNYQHAIAWHRAFREHGYRAAIWEIHRHVGMGGDQLVEALLGEEAENADGEALRDAHSEAVLEADRRSRGDGGRERADRRTRRRRARR